MSKIKELIKNKYFVFFGGLFVLFLLVVQFRQYRARRGIEKEIQELSQQSDQLQKNNQDLQSMIAYLKTDAYKEKAAREQLSMQKEGESVYSFSAVNSGESRVASSELVASMDQNTNVRNPIKWWNYFFKTN